MKLIFLEYLKNLGSFIATAWPNRDFETFNQRGCENTTLATQITNSLGNEKQLFYIVYGLKLLE